LSEGVRNRSGDGKNFGGGKKRLRGKKKNAVFAEAGANG